MIQHNEAETIKVFKSRDYKQFEFLKGNRPINDRKLKKIINEIDNGNDMLKYYPIQVKEEGGKLMILDGQHRYYLSKFFQRPVFYILVKEDKEMAEIAKVNSNVEKWKMDDFLNCYLDQGNENYAIVKDFLKRYEFNYSVALKLLSSGTPGTETTNSDVNEAFKNGTFEVKRQAAAEQLGQACVLFRDSGLHKSKSFAVAIYRIMAAGKITMEDLHQAYLKRPHMLTRQASYKGYINCLEQIINVNKQNRIVII